MMRIFLCFSYLIISHCLAVGAVSVVPIANSAETILYTSTLQPYSTVKEYPFSIPITVVGSVIDSVTGKVISSASVVILGLGKKDITHLDGTFHFYSLQKTTYSIGVRAVGYRTKIFTFTFKDDSTLVLPLSPFWSITNEILVESDKISSTHSITLDPKVLSAQEIDEHRGQTIGELLQQITGVTLLQTGPSISKPVIRGLHSQRIVVVNNGTAQEGQQWGAEHAPEIDPFSPHKIEVIKGAAGVEYGIGALGGVIRLEPRDLRYGSSLGGIFSLQGFSNNAQGVASLLLEDGNVPIIDTLFGTSAWRAQISARSAADAHAPAYVLSNTGFREVNASVATGITTKESQTELLYSYFSTTLGILRASHIGNISDLERAIAQGTPLVIRPATRDINPPKQEISHHTMSVITKIMTSYGKWNLQYSWQRNERSEFDSHNTRISDSTILQQALLRPAMNLSLSTYSAEAKLQHHEVGPVSGVIGLSLQRQANTRSGRVFLIPDYLAWSAGAFILENYTYDAWSFNLGIRADYRYLNVSPIDRNSGRNLQDTTLNFVGGTGSIGVLYSFSPSTQIRANVTSGWRPPNVNELYSNDVHHGTAQFEIGNTRLQPEQAFSGDCNFVSSSPTWSIDASVYVNYINNFMYLRPDAKNPTITFRGVFPTMNYTQDNVRFFGSEIKVQCVVQPWWRIESMASFVRATTLGDNQPLIFMPSDRVSVSSHFHLSEYGALHEPFIELLCHAVRRQDNVPLAVDYTTPPAGYILYDIRIGTSVSLFESLVTLSIEGKNILNTEYRDYLSRYRYFGADAGRNIIFRMSVPFGSSRQ